MALKFHNVKVIEQIPTKEKIQITEGNLFAGPLRIQEAEEWEHRLQAQKTPYILAEAETSLPIDNGQEEAPVRLARGYFLFISKKEEIDGTETL